MDYVSVVIDNFWQYSGAIVSSIVGLLVFKIVMSIIFRRLR